jgi:hypothetical protein
VTVPDSDGMSGSRTRMGKNPGAASFSRHDAEILVQVDKPVNKNDNYQWLIAQKLLKLVEER